MFTARMRWEDLKQELRDAIWPAGEPQNLIGPHDKNFVEAIIDLQQSIDCLTYNNTSIFPHCSTYFMCGLTVFEQPHGIIRKVYTVDRINQTTGKEDATVATDWCSKVVYNQTAFCNLETYVSKTISCSSGLCGTGPSLSSLFAFPAGLCNKNTFTPPTDVGWEGFDALPQGLHYPQDSTDSTCGRSLAGVWAVRRGRVYLAPWIQSTESVVVEWDGIKREWADDDLVEADPLLRRAIRFYVATQHARDYDNEFDKADLLWTEFQKARAELMYNCREENRVRGCEESAARQSIGTLEAELDGAGTSPLADNTPAEVQNQATCGAIAPVLFDPPSGAIVTFPTWVTLTCATPGPSIYFTLDGTVPNRGSTLYTGPFVIPAGTVIRAIGAQGDCIGDGSLANNGTTDSDFIDAATITDSPPTLTTLCTTIDKAGRWYIFHPDGSIDINWQLEFDFLDTSIVTRLEIYETDNNGLWTSGRCWATDYTIYPAERGGASFNSYPLVITENGVQRNTQYEASLGAVSALPHDWRLFGESVGVVSSGKFYKLIIFRADGLVFYATSNIVCTAGCESDLIVDDGSGIATVQTSYGIYTLDFVFAFADGGWILVDVTSTAGAVQVLQPALGTNLGCLDLPTSSVVVEVIVAGVIQTRCFTPMCPTTTTTTTTTSSTTTLAPGCEAYLDSLPNTVQADWSFNIGGGCAEWGSTFTLTRTPSGYAGISGQIPGDPPECGECNANIELSFNCNPDTGASSWQATLVMGCGGLALLYGPSNDGAMVGPFGAYLPHGGAISLTIS